MVEATAGAVTAPATADTGKRDRLVIAAPSVGTVMDWTETITKT